MSLLLVGLALVVGYYLFVSPYGWSGWGGWGNYGWGGGYHHRGPYGMGGERTLMPGGMGMGMGMGMMPGMYDFPTLGEEGQFLIDMGSDGDALFRALSDQLYRDGGRRCQEVRRNVIAYLIENRSHFRSRYYSLNLPESYSEYLRRMEMPGQYPSQIEVDAFVACTDRSVIIHYNDGTKRNLFSTKSAESGYLPLQIANYVQTPQYLSLRLPTQGEFYAS